MQSYIGELGGRPIAGFNPDLQATVISDPSVLTPLLLKAGGPLRNQIQSHCVLAASLLDDLAESLGIVRPNAFRGKACPTDLLTPHLYSIMTLGLRHLGETSLAKLYAKLQPSFDMSVVANESIGQGFQRLVTELSNDWSALLTEQAQCMVESYGLRLECEEPNGGAEWKLSTVRRRREEATSRWCQHVGVRVSERASSPNESLAELEKHLAAALRATMLTSIKRSCGGFASLKAFRASLRDGCLGIAAGLLIPAPGDQFDRLVDRTVLFLRTEMMKDVLGSFDPSRPRPGDERTHQIRRAGEDLREALAEVISDPDQLGTFKMFYCILVFSGPRVQAMAEFLGVPESLRILPPVPVELDDAITG